jgi:hypothetical protein
LNAEIKRILSTEEEHPLRAILELNNSGELVWKSGYYAGQKLQYAHIVSQATIKNAQAERDLAVALENMNPVGDVFHQQTYGHLGEVLTKHGTTLSGAAKESIRNVAEELPSRSRNIPISRGERGFIVPPTTIGDKLVRFGLRWMGPIADVIFYASAIHDSYKTMSGVAIIKAREYATTELLESFPSSASSLVYIEDYPMIFDVKERVLYEYEIGLWRQTVLGTVLKAVELPTYSAEANVYFDERMAVYTDSDGKWRFATTAR